MKSEMKRSRRYGEILDRFIPSEAMRKYLMCCELSDSDYIDMILNATVPLREKAEALKLLPEPDGLMEDIEELPLRHRRYYRGLSPKWCRGEIQRALDALECRPGEIIYYKDIFYDSDTHFENEHGVAPFTSLGAAEKYLRNQISLEEWDDESLNWSIFEKWSPGEDGTMENPYTYYLIGGEVVYFESNHYDSEYGWWSCDSRRFSSQNTDLILPIPFKAGDIVTLDCRPFAPIKHALIINADNSDCCGVRMLCREEDDGLWNKFALKHRHGWGAYTPMVSPLYRLVLSDEEELIKSPDAELLKKAREIINKSSRNRTFIDDSMACYGLSDDELRKQLDEIGS